MQLHRKQTAALRVATQTAQRRAVDLENRIRSGEEQSTEQQAELNENINALKEQMQEQVRQARIETAGEVESTLLEMKSKLLELKDTLKRTRMERDAVTATLQRVEAGGSGAAAVAMYEAVTGLRLSRDKESGKFFCEILESDPLSQADETAAACVKFSLSVEENGDISYAPGTFEKQSCKFLSGNFIPSITGPAILCANDQ